MALLAVLEAATLFSLSPILPFAASLRGNDAEPFPSPACGLEHAQPAEPEALRHPWGAVWTQDWTDKYSRDPRENFESRCWPVTALLPLPHCVWLAAQVSPSGWAGISHSDSLSSRNTPAACPGWRDGRLSSSAAPSHSIYCGSVTSRPGTEFVSCMAPW